ncbi:hypothetical protein [Streptomyces griseofuscus]|uniref:Uncharacterized protein n=1 Tax=Streptomyces griseofuscus TaxID=146922 RepID=A0A7H1Q3R6_9ACTN|nr:hypothetical protein [Streptomyces griseofuscus]QNT94946.1 hypothetical protein HEP81_04674 [Streptomyces griseofuscus]
MTGTAAGIGTRPDPAPCNALTASASGLLVPGVLIQVDPGLTVTPPAAGACPQVWRIGVDAAWVQNGTLNFLHTLTGALRAWETVPEVPLLTIPRAGVWEVNFQVRGVASLPAPGAAATDTGVVVGMYKNGALVPGTEAMVIYHSEAAGDQGKQIQATGSRQFMHTFAAGDTVGLGAYRLGTSGSAAVVSNGDGRTYISAHWVAPEGDSPA